MTGQLNPRQTVEHIYAAFGRGDVGAILEQLSEDVIWEYAYSAGIAPWLEPRRGRAGVAGFFEALGTQLQVERFQVHALLAEGPLVVALFDFEAQVRATGKRIREHDEAHVWRFGPDGKVARFRHTSDTLQHWRAAAAR